MLHRLASLHPRVLQRPHALWRHRNGQQQPPRALALPHPPALAAVGVAATSPNWWVVPRADKVAADPRLLRVARR